MVHAQVDGQLGEDVVAIDVLQPFHLNNISMQRCVFMLACLRLGPILAPKRACVTKQVVHKTLSDGWAGMIACLCAREYESARMRVRAIRVCGVGVAGCTWALPDEQGRFRAGA